MYTCRECEREINQAAEVCPYCGTDLSSQAGETETPKKKPSLLKTLIRYAVLLGAIWGFLWYVMPERRGQEAASVAERRAVDALRIVHDVLSNYAGAQGGTYPSSLEALPGDSFSRVREAAQEAQREGYRLAYSVASESSEGHARHYVLVARPGNYGYRNFYVDETGVIRATRENRAATGQDPPI
jgi:hypothetical protein